MQGAKVLVVDDSTSVRKVLERLLVTRGLQVYTAETAEQGLEQVAKHSPDLVIADVVMPGMSGFELCQLLQLNKRTQSIPVILISGIINDGVVAQANQAGAFAVVSKPFTPDDLFPKIEGALAQASGASHPPTQPTQEEVILAPQVPAQPEPAPAPQPPLEPVAAPPPPAAVAQPIQLQAELRPFLEKPEVETVLLAQQNGKLLAWAGEAIEDPESLAAYVRTLLSISGVMGERYQLSSLQGLNLEYLGKTLMISRIGDSTALALIIRGTGGSGVIRYLIAKQMPQLKEALAQA